MASPTQHTTATDHELFSSIAEGDEKAFEALFYRYLPVLGPFVIGMVKSDQLAEETIHDTFLSIWLSRDKLPTIENPKAWIYRIASNQSLNKLDKIARERKNQQHYNNTATVTTDGTNQAELSEIKTIVHEVIEKMPEQRKKIYLMSRGEGLSHAEIAEQLQISPGTVKKTIHSALGTIRDTLKAHGYWLPVIILNWLR